MLFRSLTDWMVDYGKFSSVRSDGGPQFRGQFDQFCMYEKIVHETSSPHHPESNGHAESAVKNMKRLVKTTKNFDEFKRALLEWRNSPRVDGLSPAQWAFGRRQKTDAPAHPGAWHVDWLDNF